MPRLDINEARVFELNGRTYACCSEGCEWILRTWPEAYGHRRQVWAKYHGWDLADMILDLGLVRRDGRTLIGQPLINMERMWTIDDIRALGYEIKDPLHG
jgi:methane monooxygenase component A alpha chain/propane monooxygenase large subunit